MSICVCPSYISRLAIKTYRKPPILHPRSVFTLKVSHAGMSDFGSSACCQRPSRTAAWQHAHPGQQPPGRGSHSSTFQLSLSRFLSLTPPPDTECPKTGPYVKPKEVDEWKPLPPGSLKGLVRVQFVNEYGMDEVRRCRLTLTNPC
jgi:hypothetical protein